MIKLFLNIIYRIYVYLCKLYQTQLFFILAWLYIARLRGRALILWYRIPLLQVERFRISWNVLNFRTSRSSPAYDGSGI